jgi:hypothetical protein
MLKPILRTLRPTPRGDYDLFIAAMGYETRAVFVASQLQPQAATKMALGFTTDHILQYEANKVWFEENGYVTSEPDEKEFLARVDDAIAEACISADKMKRPVRVGIDISSTTRVRIAELLQLVEARSSDRSIEMDFFYALAEYSPPPTVIESNTHVGPVVPTMSGWWSEPERPVAAAVGLGYEENKALGAVEHIQVTSIFTFSPRSPIEAYAAVLDEANKTLLQQVQKENRFVYRVDEPLDTFVQLEAFVFGVTRTHNLVLLPFGPKIFALCAMLIAIIHPEIAIWRVSGSEERVDRKANGEIYGLTVLYGHSL